MTPERAAKWAAACVVASVGALVLGCENGRWVDIGPLPDAAVRTTMSVAEVWPSRGSEPPPSSLSDHARGCAIVAACGDMNLPPEGAWSAVQRGQTLRACLLPHPEEEAAIPIGSIDTMLAASNERWSWWLSHALPTSAPTAGTGCNALAMLTPRPVDVMCDAHGCSGHGGFVCTGDVAARGDGGVVDATTDGSAADGATDASDASDASADGDASAADGASDASAASDADAASVADAASAPPTSRDCSRAFAKCSSASSTGCTDRVPLACDATQLGRCDGDVVVSCDSTGKAYVADCTRFLGGHCQETEIGAHCVYPSNATCTLPTCVGAKLSVCIGGANYVVDCAALGLAACTTGTEGAFCGSPLPPTSTGP